MKNRTLLLAAALLFAITPMVAGASAGSQTQTSAYESGTYCGVSDGQIYEYMLQYGYHVLSITPIQGTCDVTVDTMEKVKCTVHISPDSVIEGFELPTE